MIILPKQKVAIRTTLIWFCFLSTIYSCGSITDNRSSELEQSVARQIDSASNHVLQFVDFKKIDGVDKQSSSSKYELSFTGFIEAKENCYWDGDVSYSILEQNKIRLRTVTIGQDSTRSGFIKKGFGHEVKGIAVFEKRDSGWVLIAIYI